MGMMRTGMNLQNDGLKGMAYAPIREAASDAANMKLKSDRVQSGISTIGSTIGLATQAAVEAKKRGWFDDIGSVMNDIF